MKKKKEVEVILISEPEAEQPNRLLWNSQLPDAIFIVPNADDEPTVERCIASAKILKMGGVLLVNFDAAVDPEVAGKFKKDLVIAAWGGNFDTQGKVPELVKTFGQQPIYCFGQTSEGHPKHPLYVDLRTPLIPFKIAEEKLPN